MLLFGVLVDRGHGGPEFDGVAGELRYVDHFGTRELVLKLRDAGLIDLLLGLGRLIRGIDLGRLIRGIDRGTRWIRAWFLNVAVTEKICIPGRSLGTTWTAARYWGGASNFGKEESSKKRTL